MKKLLSTAVVVFFTMSAFSQVEEEAIFITGGLNFSSYDAAMDGGGFTIDAKGTDFGLQVGGGYMFSDMFGAGLRLGYGSEKLTSDSDVIDQSTKTGVFTVAPFVRSYIEIDEPLYAIFDFTTAFGFGNNNMTQTVAGSDISTDQKFNMLDINLAPGLSYFLSDNFALEIWYGYIGYNSLTDKIDDGMGSTIDVKTGAFTFNADLSTIRFGLTYMFNN